MPQRDEIVPAGPVKLEISVTVLFLTAETLKMKKIEVWINAKTPDGTRVFF